MFHWWWQCPILLLNLEQTRSATDLNILMELCVVSCLPVLFGLEPPYALVCTCYLTEKLVKRVNCSPQLIIRFLASCVRNWLTGGGNVYESRPSVTCSSMTPFVQLPDAVVDCRIKRCDQKLFGACQLVVCPLRHVRISFKPVSRSYCDLWYCLPTGRACPARRDVWRWWSVHGTFQKSWHVWLVSRRRGNNNALHHLCTQYALTLSKLPSRSLRWMLYTSWEEKNLRCL